MSASFCKLEGAHITICESNKLQSPQYKWIITKCFKVAKKKNANEHIMHIAMCNDTSINKIGLRERIYQWQWVWWKSLQLQNQLLTRVQSNNPYQKWEHHLHVLLVARRWHVSSYCLYHEDAKKCSIIFLLFGACDFKKNSFCDSSP